MNLAPAFKELYVISDLHLGGASGFQIFDEGVRAEKLIDHLAQVSPAERLGLVINGDFVDFLAEPGGTYFDPYNAAKKLRRISEDAAFSPVWRALRRFVRKKNRSLVVTLGNHDLELGLPWIREEFLDLLAGGDAAARGRIHLALDGCGFRCRVGDAEVLCVHGNEVDAWNLTDYEQLRRIGRDILQGRPFDGWKSNAGTRMVIEVMNEIKARFPFVDLLKPEAEAVVPTLVALDPSHLQKLARIGSPVLRLGWDSIRKATGFLAFDAEIDRPVRRAPDLESTSVHLLIKETFSQLRNELGQDDGDRLFAEVEERFRRNENPLDVVKADEQEGYLNYITAAWQCVRGKEPSEVLRTALAKLGKDQSFETNYEDSTFKRLDEITGREIAFLTSGHTHLERAIARKHGPGAYFNSGTWVRRIRFKPEMLESARSFARVFQVLSAGNMATLDEEPGLILRNPTVIAIWNEGAVTKGELRRVSTANSASPFEAIPNTQYSRG